MEAAMDPFDLAARLVGFGLLAVIVACLVIFRRKR